MSDTRKRTGAKGTTYQVRYPSTSTKSGYAYKSFATRKEAQAYLETLGSVRANERAPSGISTVPQAVQRWLDICEEEGTDGKDPVTVYTLKNYYYIARFMTGYPWEKELRALETPDIVRFRSWLIENCPSRFVARRTLTLFHSVLREMALRGYVAANVASGVTIASASRYDQPVTPPSLEEFYALPTAADRLANSRNAQIARSWERYRPMLYLAGDTGMRPGEYLALPKCNLGQCKVKVDHA